MLQVPNAKEILKQLLQSKVTTVSLRDSCSQPSEQQVPNTKQSIKKQHNFTINVIYGNQTKPITVSNAKFTITAQQQGMNISECWTNKSQVDQRVKNLEGQLDKLRKQIGQQRKKEEKIKKQYQIRIQELQNKINQQCQNSSDCKEQTIKQLCQKCKKIIANQGKDQVKTNKQLTTLQNTQKKLQANSNVIMVSSQSISCSMSCSAKVQQKVKPRIGSINSLKKIRKIVQEGNSQKKSHQTKAQFEMQISFCSEHSIIDGLNNLNQFDN